MLDDDQNKMNHGASSTEKIPLDEQRSTAMYGQGVQPHIQDEQAMSGSTPDPDSADDTLAAAQEMGMQADETTENPQELDIARDIDAGEEAAHQ